MTRTAAPARRRRPANRSTTVVGYLRCSTDEQAVSGLGLAAQRVAIEAEAARRGWGEVRFIADEGWSARSLDRPGIAQALAELEAGRAGALVVSRLDRLSRSTFDTAGLMEQARREGWQLVALDLGIDTASPMGEAMASVGAVFAQLERRLIGQRTKDALAAKKAKGARLGRPRQLPDAVAHRIAGARAAGLTLGQIADDLNADGVPTAQPGGTWWPATVSRALHSLALDAEAAAARSVAS